jgi:hypothetical protein
MLRRFFNLTLSTSIFDKFSFTTSIKMASQQLEPTKKAPKLGWTQFRGKSIDEEGEEERKRKVPKLEWNDYVSGTCPGNAADDFQDTLPLDGEETIRWGKQWKPPVEEEEEEGPDDQGKILGRIQLSQPRIYFKTNEERMKAWEEEAGKRKEKAGKKSITDYMEDARNQAVVAFKKDGESLWANPCTFGLLGCTFFLCNQCRDWMRHQYLTKEGEDYYCAVKMCPTCKKMNHNIRSIYKDNIFKKK